MPPSYRLAEQPHVPASRREHPAFVRGDRSLTFAELDRRAGQFAAGARRAGLVPGDRVLVLQRNALETFEALVGCARAGLVAVPVNWRLAPDELRAVAADAAARGLVAEPDLLEAVGPVDLLADPALVLELGEPYESWLAQQHGDGVAVGADPDAVVLQVYTSGTSGRPKGVQLTNRNLAAKVPRTSPLWGLSGGSVSLLATPLFHVGALSWGLAGLAAGCTTIIAGDATATTLLHHLVGDGVTHTFLVPAMIGRLCQEAPEGTTFPALTTIVYGASPISPETQRSALRLFGPVLHHVYGLSETTGAVTELAARPDLAPDDPLYRSVGRPYPWVELEVRDPAGGGRLAPGEFGEVWVRSEQNTPGYAGLPEETSALLTSDGWLRTGDGGYLDEQGYLFLTDRLKDLIITGGENVYPAEVEAVLRTHPDVADVAVFGVPDPTWGETVATVIVARQGSALTADDVVAFAGDRLAGYKRPRRVVLVDELPRNATGKVLRHQLAEVLT